MYEFQVYSSGANVAINNGNVANQSSTFKDNTNFKATNAIDGNNATFSHTNDTNAYWQLFLTQSVDVDSIVILNRWCNDENDKKCLCRLSQSTIILYDENDLAVATRSIGDTCNQTIVTETFTSSTGGINADRVRLESTTGQVLHMFELDVYTSSGNAAMQGTASQSSTFKNDPDKFAASKAIDGSNTTFSHTENGYSSAWWEVDLNGSVDVESISILNRWCLNNADCLCRLSNATVIFYENNVVVATRQLGNTCEKLLISEEFTSSTPSASSSPTSNAPVSSSPSSLPTSQPTPWTLTPTYTPTMSR
jgi:hypothetical protein